MIAKKSHLYGSSLGDVEVTLYEDGSAYIRRGRDSLSVVAAELVEALTQPEPVPAIPAIDVADVLNAALVGPERWEVVYSPGFGDDAPSSFNDDHPELTEDEAKAHAERLTGSAVGRGRYYARKVTA